MSERAGERRGAFGADAAAGEVAALQLRRVCERAGERRGAFVADAVATKDEVLSRVPEAPASAAAPSSPMRLLLRSRLCSFVAWRSASARAVAPWGPMPPFR